MVLRDVSVHREHLANAILASDEDFAVTNCHLLLCRHCRTLLPAYPEALVVQDAQKDARFKDNPLVSIAHKSKRHSSAPTRWSLAPAV